MKFLQILGFASLALAAVVDKRQTTVTGSLVAIVDTLEDTVQDSLAVINTAIEEVEDETDPSIVIEFAQIIIDRLQNIVGSLGTAATDIIDVTAGAGGGVGGIITTLTLAQVQQVRAAVEATERIVDGLGVALEVTLTDLTPALQDAIDAEVDALRAAIAPFVNPLLAFATDVRNGAPTVFVVISGLRNAITELRGVIARLVAGVVCLASTR